MVLKKLLHTENWESTFTGIWQISIIFCKFLLPVIQHIEFDCRFLVVFIFSSVHGSYKDNIRSSHNKIYCKNDIYLIYAMKKKLVHSLSSSFYFGSYIKIMLPFIDHYLKTQWLEPTTLFQIGIDYRISDHYRFDVSKTLRSLKKKERGVLFRFISIEV